MSAARILRSDEYHRLPNDVADFLGTMNAEDAAVVVVEDGGRILGRMVVMRVPHWECFDMVPEAVGNAGVTRALLRAATEQAQKWAPHWFYANADKDETIKTVERLGGQFMPMHTFLVPFRRMEMEEASCQQR